MNYKKIQTNVNPKAKQKFLKGEKHNEVVLLIHGYNGIPNDMYYLGERLNEEGYNVFIPRLPGHGTNKEDFINSNWKDWIRYSYESYLNLKSQYDNVYIGGLSMGGVITAILASKFQPKKIFLCAPAFIAKDKRLKWTPILKYFIKEKERKNPPTFEDKDLKKLAEEYWNFNIISKVSDLKKVQKIGIKNLKNIKSKTLTIISKKDEAVPFEVKEIIDKNIKSEYLILEKSNHIVVNDTEKEIVAQKIIEFLK
jgi:carboxylesterase